ncbi:MAG: hypothetical protein WEF86_14555 [Gemmatimonadota bacterium]
MRTNLFALAHGRSGDKGDTVNVGVIARRPEYYDLLCHTLTTERVKQHFGDLVKGSVERFELPNLHALNFLLHEALGGGGTVSLMTDAQGKTFSTALLRMEIDVPDSLAALIDVVDPPLLPLLMREVSATRSHAKAPEPVRPSKPGLDK